jgi:hypothetical protein
MRAVLDGALVVRSGQAVARLKIEDTVTSGLSIDK